MIRPAATALLLVATAVGGCTTTIGSSTPEVLPAVDELGCADLFDQAFLPTYAIQIAPAEWDAMVDEHVNWRMREADGLDLKPYHPLEEFRYRDEVVTNAMIRLKGNPCCSWTEDKMQFVISFNEIDPAGRFHGLRKLVLDAPPYDPSYLRERLALRHLRAVGLPAACANDARLEVNGAYYGLFVHLERVDKEMLERVFGDEAADGNLYKLGEELVTNEDAGDTSRREAWWAVDDAAGLDALADVDQLMAVWAAEAALPQTDGFLARVNYYLYDHPTRGFVLLPYDLDAVFADSPTIDPMTFQVDRGPYRPARHVELVLADPELAARYQAAIAAAQAAYAAAADALVADLDTWAAQIAPAQAEEPHVTFTPADHEAEVAAVRAFLPARVAYMQRWITCDGGDLTDDQDGDGAPMCRDCDDADPAVHPGAEEVCNDLDDDCDGQVDEIDACPDCLDVDLGSGVRVSLCARPRTWAAARDNCVVRGATMFVPASQTEQDVIVRTLKEASLGEEFWLGATDEAADGTWTDAAGTALTFTAWGAARPDGAAAEACVVGVHRLQGAWDDQRCDRELLSLCRLP